VRPGLVLLLSGIAVLFLASSLLADDGGSAAYRSSLPDSMTANPGSLVGVRPKFDIEEMPEIRHSPMKVVLFSTAVPGLGQAANGRWAKASAFIAVGSLLVSRALVESERADRYLHLSRSATTDEEAQIYYDRYSSHFDRRDRFVWWAISFWVYNMLDAYIDGNLFGFSRQ
jgi:hypothetical protein